LAHTDEVIEKTLHAAQKAIHRLHR
jgi:hypothetical protein